MRLLVTGGAGFTSAASSLNGQLLGGRDVVVIDNLQEGHRAAVSVNTPHSSWATTADRLLLDRVFAEQPFDAMLHLAAETTVATSVSDPAIYFGEQQHRQWPAPARGHAPARRVNWLVFSSTATRPTANRSQCR